MRKTNLIIWLLCLLVTSPVCGQNSFLQLIPKPQKMEVKSSDAWMFHELRFLELTDKVERPIMGPMLDLLSQEKQSGKSLKLVLNYHEFRHLISFDGFQYIEIIILFKG